MGVRGTAGEDSVHRGRTQAQAVPAQIRAEARACVCARI